MSGQQQSVSGLAVAQNVVQKYAVPEENLHSRPSRCTGLGYTSAGSPGGAAGMLDHGLGTIQYPQEMPRHIKAL